MPILRYLSIALFLAAGAALLLWTRGSLMWPGIVAVLGGILFCVMRREMMAVACGTIGAGVSLTAQALSAICPQCMLCAVLMGAAGLTAGFYLIRSKPGWMLVLLSPILIGCSVLSISLATAPVREMPVATMYSRAYTMTTAIAPERPENDQELAIPRLYFSPWCGHCDEVLAAFIEHDPEGTSWVPVIVPKHAFKEGQTVLLALGYEGSAMSASQAPGLDVPVLEAEGKLYVGASRIIDWFH